MTCLNLIYTTIRNMAQGYSTGTPSHSKHDLYCHDAFQRQMKMNPWKHISESMNSICLKSSLPLTQHQHFYPQNEIVQMKDSHLIFQGLRWRGIFLSSVPSREISIELCNIIKTNPAPTFHSCFIFLSVSLSGWHWEGGTSRSGDAVHGTISLKGPLNTYDDLWHPEETHWIRVYRNI